MRVPARIIVIGTALLAVGVLTVGGTPGRPRCAVAEAGTGASAQGDPRGAIFVQRGCAECHAIAALGVKAGTDVGPDLTFAYADVVNRYGLTLESFLDNPQGLMGFVFASHVHLTQSDRDSISRTLEALYHERLSDMDENIPSFPPARFRPRARAER